MIYLAGIVLAMAYILGGVQGETASPILVVSDHTQDWPDGFKMLIRFQLLEDVRGGWTMTLRFSKPAPNLKIWRAVIVDYSSDNTVYNLTNMSWNEDFLKCSFFEAYFIADKDYGADAPTATVEFHRKIGDNANLDPHACSPTTPPTTAPKTALKEETATPILLTKPNGWPRGFKMKIRFQLLDDVKGGWTMTLKFSKATPGLEIWRAKIVSTSEDKKVYILKNMRWNKNLKKCFVFEADFTAKKDAGTDPPTAIVEFHRNKTDNINLDPNACPTTMPPTTSAPVTTTASPVTTTASPVTTTASPVTTTASPVTTEPETSPLPTTTEQPPPTTVTTIQPTTLPSSPPTEWPLTNGQTTTANIVQEWETGFKMIFKFLITEKITDGWVIKMSFSKPGIDLKIWRAQLISVSDDSTEYYAKNMPYNAVVEKCTVLEIDFMANKKVRKESAPKAVITLYRKDGVPASGSSACATIPPTTVSPVTTAAPVQTTAAPVTTTAAPVTTTAAPATTTAAPVTTTAAPVTTTAAPATTTAAPITTTAAPVTTEQSTQPPVPATTTQQPSTQTEIPTTKHTTVPPTTSPVTASPTPYDYDQVLHDSILFYEAQRSGKLPSTNRITWRGDSALNDKGDKGENLTGGWYDAGDFVKFGFPMASSVTVLAWGIVEYRDAYKAVGELDNVLDSIKWATDYFVKAHTAKLEFYGQVGDGHVDHAYWGRPEEMTMNRPAFKITTSKPGSELAAETAAALAATSIAFKPTDPGYANTLLKHAEQLYEFADKYRGKYSDSITNAADFYKSYSGYNDELVWGAVWLYRATKKQEYLAKAEDYYVKFNMKDKPWAFSWDDKKSGAQVLLAEITGKAKYKQHAQTYLDSWLPGGEVEYTPKGLAWRAQWGPTRYSANTAFLALVAADIGIQPTAYRAFARKQIHYMLGDGGRSFVVGFGKNPPLRPHHTSSSCPNKPATCDWKDFNSAGPNPQTLTGALVGGPDKYDNYKDDRKDYIQSEVTTDYNAGFQSAVAGLKHLSIV